MNSSTLSKQTVSFGCSLAFCALLNAFLVIAKETRKPVSAWMQTITGHHWITHVVFMVGAFGAFGWLAGRLNAGQGPAMTAQRLTKIVVLGVAAGVVIILGFYLVAD
jgi:small-conductance mechanosensitive channel